MFSKRRIGEARYADQDWTNSGPSGLLRHGNGTWGQWEEFLTYQSWYLDLVMYVYVLYSCRRLWREMEICDEEVMAPRVIAFLSNQDTNEIESASIEADNCINKGRPDIPGVTVYGTTRAAAKQQARPR